MKPAITLFLSLFHLDGSGGLRLYSFFIVLLAARAISVMLRAQSPVWADLLGMQSISELRGRLDLLVYLE